MAVVGKVLLIILLLLLAILLLVLFFPIFYHVQARKSPDEMTAKLKVSWLFGFVRALFDYPEPKKLIVKLLFFTILGKDKPEGKKQKKKDNNKKDKNKKDNKQASNNAGVEAQTETDLNSDENSDQNPKEPEYKLDKEENGAESESEEGDASSPKWPSKEQASPEQSSKEQAAPEQAPEEQYSEEQSPEDHQSKKKAPKKELRALYHKAKSEYDFYHGLWLKEETRAFVSSVLKRVLHILKNLMPRSIKGKLVFGAASPDVTGYVYGAYCVLNALYPQKLFLSLEPDFEREILECDLVIKGHFTIFTLLIDGLRILLDRRLRRLKRILDKHREQGEGKSKQ